LLKSTQEFNLIQIERSGMSADGGAKDANTAALAVLVRIGIGKRLAIRVFEAIARPLVVAMEWLGHCSANTAGEVRRILVLEYWNLGDIVMELPFLQNLRIHYPDAHIVLMTSPKVAPLIEHQGLVDEVVVVRVPWAQHYSRWRKYNPFSLLWLQLARTLIFLHRQHFDLALTARADIRDNFIIWFTEVRRRVGYAFGGGSFFLTDVVKPDLERPHLSDRWLKLIEHLGKPIVVRQPHLRLVQAEERFAEEYLAERGIQNGDFLIGIHSGARSATRQWGEKNFLKLAQPLLAQFPIKILWFRDPNQEPLALNGNQPALDRTRLVPLSPLPLRQFMALLKRCRLLICNDSGPMHIATGLKVPVVAIFGPTEPTWCRPLGDDNHVVIHPGFWCRPCLDYCRFDQPYCIRAINVESVFQTSVEALNTLLLKTRQASFREQLSGCEGDQDDSVFRHDGH
jgi:lipopolysaccharide heptosyltransferase II